MNFEFEVNRSSDLTLVSLRGPINESSGNSLEILAAQLPSGTCIFNFREVNLINSVGSSSWIRFIKRITTGRKLIFEECSPATVAQLNMVPSFLGEAEVRSVCAPYWCKQCDSQDLLLLVKGENLPEPGGLAPKLICKRCASEMEFEGYDLKFFKFTQSKRPKNPPK